MFDIEYEFYVRAYRHARKPRDSRPNFPRKPADRGEAYAALLGDIHARHGEERMGLTGFCRHMERFARRRFDRTVGAPGP